VQYDTGLTDFNNVTVTQRDLFALQQQVAISEAKVALGLIGLYKAVGGGWQR
jgi:outer membrane protein TolC